MNKINDNRFNATDENNLASVYELIPFSKIKDINMVK